MECLLLHGLGGTPDELTPLAQRLAAAGLRVSTPLLPGHGASEAAWLASAYGQWRAAARAAYAACAAQGPTLLGGYSLGGLLALDLAVEAAAQAPAHGEELPAPAGLLAVATPLFLHHWRPFFTVGWRCLALPLWSRLTPVLRLPPRSAASRAVAPWRGFETVCSLRHLRQMAQAQARVRRGLGLLRAPLCVIQLWSDASCHPYNAWYLARRAAAAPTRLHLLPVRSPHGGHLPISHRESRETVAALAVEFARSLSGGPGSAAPCA
ncbi:alpha/beta hydrolase [Desulfovibrio legallii]|uniref:Carboxylesterase n=1 Tax=Desulfovibrio legallii TaxID=571438 RepID=A0A1G7MKV7_9BACT|nr:alpha/beta fold hydrolase [Desulfovibrio legallii]SDF62415.1 carboxylesterase [Desulfovibrio legallii]